VRARRAVRSVGIVAKPRAREARGDLERLTALLQARRIRPLLDREAARILGRAGGQERERLAAAVELIVVLGGDGTLLSIARAAARSRAMILGVNLGSLGFLTEVQRPQMIAEVDRILSGSYEVDERMLLEVRVLRGGRVVLRENALNDVVISKQATIARAVDLQVGVNGRFVTSYKADGLIIATPTGSTAYSLSAGGPIMDPNLELLIMNPICPHTLTQRSLVLRDSVRIDVALIRHDDEGVFLTLDGQFGHRVRSGDTIRVGRARQRVRLVRSNKRDYFKLLRTKLKWGERLTR
jgi:NAD+ kinase